MNSTRLKKGLRFLYSLLWCVGIIYTASNIYKNISQGFFDDQFGRMVQDPRTSPWIPGVSVYREYSSNISQRESIETNETNVTFPDVLLCAGEIIWGHRIFFLKINDLDSMHSKMQLEKFYPNIDISMIYKLYGLNVDPAFKSMWDYKGTRLHFRCKQLLGDLPLMKNCYKNRCRIIIF